MLERLPSPQAWILWVCGRNEDTETNQRWKDDLDHRGFASHSVKFLLLPKGNMIITKSFSRKTT